LNATTTPEIHTRSLHDALPILRPPSAEHWFGTDEFGRDILSRVIFGARISLFTGLVPVFAASVVGTLVGLVAGFYRGRVDAVLRSEEHTSELQSRENLVCRLLL